MFVAVCAIALLCLVSLSHSAPLSCEDLVRPLDQLDPHYFEGRWVLVAGSLNDSAAVGVLKDRDSITIELHNTSYTQAYRVGDRCNSYSHNISLEGHILRIKVKTFNFTGTFYHTSCKDCIVMSLAMVSPDYKRVEFLLFSRRREVEQEVMEVFRAQVQCLNMPPPHVMDPTKELCPEQADSKPEKTEEQKA
ncbi:hypothetical protein ABVT39_012724 [Epinephelus coioides]